MTFIVQICFVLEIRNVMKICMRDVLKVHVYFLLISNFKSLIVTHVKTVKSKSGV